MRLAVLNGPNLNLLGSREPEIYGRETLAQIEDRIRAAAAARNCEVSFFQSNHEGELIDHAQSEATKVDGIIINPGALAHYSWALYDCLRALSVPVVEVHLTNVHARPEPFRHQHVTAAAARGVLTGFGSRGYLMALEYLIDRDQ